MIDHRSNLSGEEFRAEYLHQKRPVVLHGMMDYWPAMDYWTPDYLKEVCGDQSVEVMSNRDSNPRFEQMCDNHRSMILFRDLVDLAFSEHQGNNTYMVANNQFMNTAGGIRLRQDVTQSSDLCMVHDVAGRMFFWLGPRGTVTPLHHDTIDIILAQVRGRKLFRMFTPDQAPLLYNSIGVFSEVDCEQPDLEKYPLYKYAVSEEVILHPGEMIFLPKGHWHQVRALDPSISVSFTNLIF